MRVSVSVLARLVVGLSLVCLVGCPDPAATCCSCIIDNGCWDHSICEEEAQASCEYILGLGELPGYAESESDICFATSRECEKRSCTMECEGITED